MIELRQAALDALQETEVEQKLRLIAAFPAAESTSFTLNTTSQLQFVGTLPGRPTKPELLNPLKVPRRSLVTREGRAALIHALAHIEFNAINLALDAIWRFPNLPAEYYLDWRIVAQEEAYHFSLLQAHLESLGSHYGQYAAHDGLWAMVSRTCDDVLARMALVPRTLEARGLDASKLMIARLTQAGDLEGAKIVNIILNDEIRHVAIGNHWYRFLCEQRQLDPEGIFSDLCLRYQAPKLRGPLNLEARALAGFTPTELESLQQQVQSA